MQLLGEDADGKLGDRWYCYKDDVLYFAGENVWNPPMELSLSTPRIAGRMAPCCRRITPHLHYSSNHDAAVKSSLALILVFEGLGLTSGAVKDSIRLNLAPYAISAYEYVMKQIAEAIAPYHWMYDLGAGMELLTILLLIMGAATLHSTTKQRLHRVTVYGAVLALLARWAASALYYIKTTQVLSVLNIDPDLLRTANDVQSSFAAEAGFWGSSAFNILSSLLLLIVSVLLAFAAWQLYSNRVVSVWPSMQPTVGTVEPVAPVAMPASAQMMAPSVEAKAETKFCRYCGAKILRDSKFCEECGGKLT
jgi:hypothetical protein